MNKKFFFIIFLLIWNCNYEKNLEISIWQQNQRAYLEFFTQYPNFQPFLELRKRRSEAIWETALKETNYKTQVQKMRLANQNLHALLGYFTQIRNKMDILKKSIVKLSNYKSATETIQKQIQKTHEIVVGIEMLLGEKTFYEEKNLKIFLLETIQILDHELDQVDEIFKKTKL